MRFDLTDPPRGWIVTGADTTRQDGVNPFVVPETAVTITGRTEARAHWQVELQFWSQRNEVQATVAVDGRRAETLTFPAGQFTTLRSASFLDAGSHTVTIRQTGAERLYWPALSVTPVSAGTARYAWRSIQWNLRGDLGTTGPTRLQVGSDGGRAVALTGEPWNVPLSGGMPLELMLMSGSTRGEYHVTVTARGEHGEEQSVSTMPLAGGTLPHVTQSNLRLPTWTTALGLQAGCVTAGPCTPVHVVQATVYGVQRVSPPQGVMPSGAFALAVLGIALALLLLGPLTARGGRDETLRMSREDTR